jgi:hypothetical protein
MPNTQAPRTGANSPSSILPQSGISILDEGEKVLFGLLLRPVKPSLEKIQMDLSAILGTSGSGPPGGDAAAKPKNDDKPATTPALSEEQKSKINNVLKNAVTGEEFSAKLRSGTAIKNSGKYILMPLPINIADGLNIQYSTAQLGALAAGYTLGNDASEAMQNGGSLADTGVTAANYAIRAALGLIPGAGGAVTALTGQVVNPFAASVFESVELRSFNFQFNIQPKSEDETNRVREVINLIRYYSLPKPNGLLLEVPWEWELGFMGTDYLYAFSRCNLIRMETNYTQNGPVFTRINAPKDISITLEFREVFPMNQETIFSFNNPSMKPSGLTREEESNDPTTGSGEGEGTDPNTGAKPEPANNEQVQRDKEISNLVSQYNTSRQEIARLEQYIATYTTPGSKERLNAEADKAKQIETANKTADDANSKMQESNNTKADGTAYTPLPQV